MLSGAGALFHEQLGWSAQAGILLTIVLSFAVMTSGVKGVFGVNILVVPLLISFSFIVTADSFVFTSTRNADEWVWPDKWNWLLSAVSYGALNLSLAQAVLVPLANEMSSEKVIRRGAYFGGVLLTLVLAASFFIIIGRRRMCWSLTFRWLKLSIRIRVRFISFICLLFSGKCLRRSSAIYTDWKNN